MAPSHLYSHRSAHHHRLQIGKDTIYASLQAFTFANTRRAKNGPCHITWAGHRRAICGNVVEKQGDTCLLFGGPLRARTDPARRAILARLK